MSESGFSIQMDVRDYECDIQGIVNNAVYQNYFEHARHEFLKSHGINFADFSKKGINLVVVRIEIDYKTPLQSGDSFQVTARMEQESRLKFVFLQDIIRLSDKKMTTRARVIGTALNPKGKPEIPQELNAIFD